MNWLTPILKSIKVFWTKSRKSFKKCKAKPPLPRVKLRKQKVLHLRRRWSLRGSKPTSPILCRNMAYQSPSLLPNLRISRLNSMISTVMSMEPLLLICKTCMLILLKKLVNYSSRKMTSMQKCLLRRITRSRLLKRKSSPLRNRLKILRSNWSKKRQIGNRRKLIQMPSISKKSKKKTINTTRRTRKIRRTKKTSKQLF